MCRKNDGHLIRIVGPAFQLVVGWASRGIPLTIAHAGIDRYVERHRAHATRRRPARIEFCDADVMEAFDAWRRAVGVGPRDNGDAVETGGEHSHGAMAAVPAEAEVDGPRGRSLPAHLVRVIERLAYQHPVERRSAALEACVSDIAAELGVIARGARRLRGPAREAVIAQLFVLDDRLMRVARETEPELWTALEHEARDELRAFEATLGEEAHRAALHRATGRLLRDRLRLPTLRYE